MQGHTLRGMQFTEVPLVMRDGEAFMTYMPSKDQFMDQVLTCGLDMTEDAPVVGRQWHSHSLVRGEPACFELAPARAFHTSEVRLLLLSHVLACSSS